MRCKVLAIIGLLPCAMAGMAEAKKRGVQTGRKPRPRFSSAGVIPAPPIGRNGFAEVLGVAKPGRH